MKVLEIVLPVLVMILLGMACRKWKLLNQNGIDNMKVLVTQIMLPVAIFHALATSDYNKETGILVGIMFVMLVISFSLGFAMRPLMPEQRYRKYLPFMVSVYEGGSMAYPLYTSLCGAENLSQIAVLDIAGLLFGFSVYMGMLGQVENGDKIDVKKLFASAIAPGFYCKRAWHSCGIIRCGAEDSGGSFCGNLHKCGEYSYNFCDFHHSGDCRLQH